MQVSVSIKLRSTFVELALYVQKVFSNHPPTPGSGYSSLSRRDLLGPYGVAETFSPDSER